LGLRREVKMGGKRGRGGRKGEKRRRGGGELTDM
jgi:hypothetical protein